MAAPAASLIAHPTDERCYEIKTRYGRSVRVTGHHSVFVEGDDGEPLAKPGKNWLSVIGSQSHGGSTYRSGIAAGSA